MTGIHGVTDVVAVQYEIVARAVYNTIETLQRIHLTSAYNGIFRGLLDMCEDIRASSGTDCSVVDHFIVLLKERLPTWRWEATTPEENSHFTTAVEACEIIKSLVQAMTSVRRSLWSVSDDVWRHNNWRADPLAVFVTSAVTMYR